MRDNFVSRVQLYDLGYRTNSLEPGGRKALHANLQESGLTLTSILEDYCFQPDANVGIVTGKALDGTPIMGLDFNDKVGAHKFITAYKISTLIAESRRGVHVYLQGEFSTKRGEADQPNISGEGSYFVAPPSQINDFQYRWLTRLREPSKLPICDPKWVQFDAEKNRPENRHAEQCKIISAPTIEWAKKILETQYFCTGTDRKYLVLLDAAAFLIQRANLDFATAFQLLMEWNSDGIHANPAWPEDTIARSIEDAIRDKEQK